jgi:hypothetical protein
MSLEKGINERRTSDKKVETQQWFQNLIQQNEYVGELYSINYCTFNTTLDILKKYFPKHKVQIVDKPLKKDTKTQTKLYGDKSMKPGEVDIILTR